MLVAFFVQNSSPVIIVCIFSPITHQFYKSLLIIAIADKLAKFFCLFVFLKKQRMLLAKVSVYERHGEVLCVSHWVSVYDRMALSKCRSINKTKQRVKLKTHDAPRQAIWTTRGVF